MIYALGAVVNLILAFLVFQFSPSLILNKESDSSNTNDPSSDSDTNANAIAYANSETNLKKSKKQSFKEHLIIFKKNAKAILSNRIFFFIVICTTCETFLIKGFSSYLTKYLEYEYRLTAAQSTILTGAIGFISMIGGALLGAYLIGKYKWTIKDCSKFITFILFITSFLFLGIMIYCPQEEYINSDSLVFQNSKYQCDSNKFNPVCYNTKYLFQTPCFAGCTFYSNNKYSNCSILEDLINIDRKNDVTFLKDCTRPAPQCRTTLVIVAFIGLAVLFLSAIIILPLLRIILESVSLENQSFALGIRSFITKLFGNIPGPIVFASIVDKACIQWTKNPLTPNKTCRLYNNKEFSRGLGLMGFSMRFLSFIFAFTTIYFISKIASVDLDDNKSKNENNEKNPGELNQTFKLNRLTTEDI